MTTPTSSPLVHPHNFTKYVLRQMIPAFSQFNQKNVLVIRNQEGILGYSMKEDIATTMNWGLQRLRELIALFAILSAEYPDSLSITIDEISIPDIVPNRIFEFLQLPKPEIVDNVTPTGGNPLRTVYREIDALATIWNYCCDLANKGITWIEQAYSQAYQQELTMAMIADFNAMNVGSEDVQLAEDVTMAYVGHPTEGTPPVPPPSPISPTCSNDVEEGMMALVVHPSASTYAQNHPGFNPFGGDFVRDVNA
ncbi:hypothetical protein CVT24_009898 [Panaeolus cyanescens]|uniref:Uncharacterized protein n=1 Tax=Panaeolus cyanescens TaxID=181874 RepID=A0A409WFC7_9AGAR|nr:hypothetical protein CVT24_009898 [Panaeolus cyanescens]